MAENDEKLLAEFEIRMRQLMYLCDVLKVENSQLKEELSQKVLIITGLESEVGELKAKYDNLKFVKSFTADGDGEDLQHTKKRLAKLVRDIDRCIAMLKY